MAESCSQDLADSEYSSQQSRSNDRSDDEPLIRDLGDVRWHLRDITASLGNGWSYTPVLRFGGDKIPASCFFTKVAVQKPKRLKKMGVMVNVHVQFDQIAGLRMTAERQDGEACRPWPNWVSKATEGVPLYGFVEAVRGFLGEEEQDEEETEEDVALEEEMLQSVSGHEACLVITRFNCKTTFLIS